MINVLNRVLLEVKLGEKFFTLVCPPDPSVEEINHVLSIMNSYCNQLIQNKVNEEPSIPVQEVNLTQDPMNAQEP
jgi:hypothetical protein